MNIHFGQQKRAGRRNHFEEDQASRTVVLADSQEGAAGCILDLVGRCYSPIEEEKHGLNSLIAGEDFEIEGGNSYHHQEDMDEIQDAVRNV